MLWGPIHVCSQSARCAVAAAGRGGTEGSPRRRRRRGTYGSKDGSCIPFEVACKTESSITTPLLSLSHGADHFCRFFYALFFLCVRKRGFLCPMEKASKRRRSKKSTYQPIARAAKGYTNVGSSVAIVPAQGFATTGTKQRMVAVPSDMLRYGGLSDMARGRELKFVDTAISLTDVSTTASLTLCNGMASGNSASTRVGRQIRMKSIEMKGISLTQTASLQNAVRYALVLDRQANATVAAFTDIYDTAVTWALRNISNKKRFKVLWDSGIISQIGNGTAGQMTTSAVVPLELYKRINIPVQYNAQNNGNIGDITTNALYFVAIGNNAAGTTDCAALANIRVRFDDD